MAVEGIGRGQIVPIELLRLRAAAQEQADGKTSRAPGSGGGDEAKPARGDAAETLRAAEAQRAAEARPHSAEERARLVDRFKSDTADLPDVRRDKVIEAKLRISTGYYNRDEVRREVLRSVLANLLPSSPATGAAPADAAESTEKPGAPDAPGPGQSKDE
jgi:hypothetical protein